MTSKRERELQAELDFFAVSGWDGAAVYVPDGMLDRTERFWSKVLVHDGHWLWTAKTNKDGRGSFAPRAGKSYLAHRLAWMLVNGPIRGDRVLFHSPFCTYKRCINPAHYDLTTPETSARVGGATGGRSRPRDWDDGPTLNVSQAMVDTLYALHRRGGEIADMCWHVGIGAAGEAQIKAGVARGKR